MIDTHCHLNFDAYEADLPAVIERAQTAGINRIINPGTDLDTCRTALDLAQQYPGVFAAVGIHPNSTASFEPGQIDELCALVGRPKVVAIGEIGLDYYWNKSPKASQWAAFEAQLTLAAELNLPVIIHNREASADVMQILEQWAVGLAPDLKTRPGVLHSFSATQAIAERALAAGFYLGFTGPITFKNAEDLRRIARTVPQDRILVETDGPFLTPVPYRGNRNEPAYIPHIVDRLASLHQLTSAEMGQITTQNAESLFAHIQPPA